DETVSLSSFAGQHVVVYFYPRADTPGCTSEACEFRDNWGRYDDAGVPVVGISDDPVSELAAFKDKYNLPFDLLSDAGGEVATAYESYDEQEITGELMDVTLRNTYVIGPDGTITAAFEGVDPEGHADEVLAAIEDAA
ncbi:peroxiredoxin, partial [Halobacterium salinarum]|nr:peroxiredoxin [Halobacterium salinarum]